jgi:glycosyltransferase involved in cell wall biosynthesis
MRPAHGPIPDGTQPTVLIFRRELLRRSETFIANQARALERHVPHLAGTRRVEVAPEDFGVAATTVLPSRFAKAAEFGLLHGVTTREFGRRLRDADLVHAHFGPDAALLVPLLTREPLRAAPFVATFHGFDATDSDDALRAHGRIAARFVAARPAMFRRADTIIAVSEFVRTRLISAGADPRKVIVHYIGIDTGFFWAPARSEAPPPSVLFLGRLHDKKGPADLLRALGRLGARGLDVRCTLAGTGVEEPALRRLAAELRIEVRFVGAFDAARARELLHEARVLCVPSRSEGFGLVFLEAQACGVPVVSYRTGGIPEAVAEGETGLLATERDIEGLAELVQTLLVDDDLWLRMSACGRRRTVERFDLGRRTAALEDIYDNTRDAARD